MTKEDARKAVGKAVSANNAARYRVLLTMKYTDQGVKVRIGGPKNGTWVTKANRRTAIRVVRLHYDRLLARALRSVGWKPILKRAGTTPGAAFRKYQGRLIPPVKK